MATVIAHTRIKRDFKKYVYFVKDGAVWQAPRRGSKGQKKIVKKWGKPSDMDYSRHIYFVDKNGNVAAANRKNSKGKRRRSSGGGRKRVSTGARKRTSAGGRKRRSSGGRKKR
jgi:hypothetical protein